MKGWRQHVRSPAARGFTLVEMLVTLTLIGVILSVTVPMLSPAAPVNLDLAAKETANILRFAFSEAKRTGGYVLVDGKTTPGQLALYNSNSVANMPPAFGTSAIIDPLTKRALVLNVADSAFSNGVNLAPMFMKGVGAYPQLLIGPGLSQIQVFDGSTVNKGTLQANSGVLLSYASQSVLVRINEVTGLVTMP